MQIQESKVKSVAKAFSLLNILERAKRGMSLQELSVQTGWPKSTIHALLSTMLDYAVVSQDTASGRYRLGMRLFELGNAVSSAWEIVDVARPHMQSIMLKTGESVHLGMLDQGELLVIEHVPSGAALRVVAERGTRFPLHCSAMGKAVLSLLPAAQWKRLAGPMQAYTPHTIIMQDALGEELTRIRAQRYSVENGEMRVGLRAVAAPIPLASSNEHFSIGVTAMFRRITDEGFQAARDLVVQAADAIAREMG